MTRVYFVEQDARVIRPDELRQLYHGQGVRTLGAELEVAPATVHRAMLRAGMRFASGWTEEDTDDD